VAGKRPASGSAPLPERTLTNHAECIIYHLGQARRKGGNVDYHTHWAREHAREMLRKIGD